MSSENQKIISYVNKPYIIKKYWLSVICIISKNHYTDIVDDWKDGLVFPYYLLGCLEGIVFFTFTPNNSYTTLEYWNLRGTMSMPLLSSTLSYCIYSIITLIISISLLSLGTERYPFGFFYDKIYILIMSDHYFKD
jgi:hypothetical protein